MKLFIVLAGLCGISLGRDIIPTRATHWRDLRDDRWEDPQGRIFQVANADEINALQDELQPGDAMIMAPGEWEDPTINIYADGIDSPGYKIYLMPEIYGETYFTGNVTVLMDGSNIEVRGIWLLGEGEGKFSFPIFFAKNTTNNRLTNSAVTGYDASEGDDGEKMVWIRIWGSYHTVDWCEFYDKATHGELLQIRSGPDIYPPGTHPESWGHYIGHNWFGPRPVTTTGDDGEGVQIGLKQSDFMDYNCTVEFNLFEDYDGEIECISVKSSNNLIQHNTFRNSACTVTLRHANRTLVQENYFFCDGKYYCGGIRMNGYDHHVLNNYIEEAFNDDAVIAGTTVYKGNSEDPYRDINVGSVIERNVMVNCSICIAAGYSFEGGDQPPVNISYIDNVMTARTENDYVYQEFEQENPYWENNMGWIGIIDREDDFFPGIRREDPGLVYDPEFKIMKPTNADFEFEMSYPPLEKEDVGTTWL